MFKFELNQLIFYVRNDRIHSAPVLSRMIVENAHENWVANKEQSELFTTFGPAQEVYATCHGSVFADAAYASRQELIDTL